MAWPVRVVSGMASKYWGDGGGFVSGVHWVLGLGVDWLRKVVTKMMERIAEKSTMRTTLRRGVPGGTGIVTEEMLLRFWGYRHDEGGCSRVKQSNASRVVDLMRRRGVVDDASAF